MPGNKTLRAQYGPQTLFDELGYRFSGISLEILAVSNHLEFLRLVFDDDGNLQLQTLRVDLENNAFHRADLNALEQHRRAYAQPLDGPVEVHDAFHGFLEEIARTEYHQAGGHNGYPDDHENADHHSVCLLSHLCPSSRLRFLATG